MSESSKWTAVESSHKQEYSHWIETEDATVPARQRTIAAVLNAGVRSDEYARLIAAAPEMAALLERMADSLAGFIAYGEDMRSIGRGRVDVEAEWDVREAWTWRATHKHYTARHVA